MPSPDDMGSIAQDVTDRTRQKPQVSAVAVNSHDDERQLPSAVGMRAAEVPCPSEVPPGAPLLLTCADCQSAQAPADCWWCRQCVKTVCKRCNLVRAHTEHRSVEWTRDEVLLGCAQALESRCSRRTQQAADEEIAVNEFIAQVEDCMTEEIRRNLERQNSIDRHKIAVLSRALNLENGRFLYHVPKAEASAWELGGDDRRVATLLREAARIADLPALLAQGGNALLPPASGRLRPASAQPPPSPSLSREPRSFAILNEELSAQEVAAWLLRGGLATAACPPASSLAPVVAGGRGDDPGGAPPLSPGAAAGGRRASFGGDMSWGRDDRGQAAPQRRRPVSTGYAGLNGSGGALGALERPVNGLPTTIATVATDDMDETDRAYRCMSSTPIDRLSAPQSSTAKDAGGFRFPLEPHVRIAGSDMPSSTGSVTRSVNNGDQRVTRPINNGDRLHRNEQPPYSPQPPETRDDDSLIDHFSVVGSDRTADSLKDDTNTSIDDRTESPGMRYTVSGTSHTLPMGSNARRPPTATTTPTLPLSSVGFIDGSSRSSTAFLSSDDDDNTSRRSSTPRGTQDADAGRHADPSTPPPPPPSVTSVSVPAQRPLRLQSGAASVASPSVNSFHFGADFLTRPIDVCALPAGRLAVSDSCNGVFITDHRGEVLTHVMPEGGGSASSLCYNAVRRHLLVSVLKKDGRVLCAYSVDDWRCQQVLLCPKQPAIELTRTRWVATTTKPHNRAGEIFLCSGDNKRSAVWAYADAVGKWLTVAQRSDARFQYLRVAEEHPDNDSVVLMFCEPVHASLLLLVVGKGGDVLSEYDLFPRYHLERFIRSPGSAVVDAANNLLVLDYARGQLWAVIDGEGGKKQVTQVGDVGGQQGLGMAVTQGWVFVACFTKRRVQAIRYLDPPSPPARPSTASGGSRR